MTNRNISKFQHAQTAQQPQYITSTYEENIIQPTRKKIKRKRHSGRTPEGAPNPIDVHIGKRVRMRREMLGYSQDHLATLLGVTFQQIQKYESGKNRISGSRLWDISQLLKVDIDYFFEDMEPETIKSSPRLMIDTAEIQELEITHTDPMKSKLNNLMIAMLEKIPNRNAARNLYMLAASLAAPTRSADQSTLMGKIFDRTEERKQILKQKT